MKKEIKEKQLKEKFSNIAKDSRSKFDANQKKPELKKTLASIKTKMVTSSPSAGPTREVNLMKHRTTLGCYPKMYSTSNFLYKT